MGNEKNGFIIKYKIIEILVVLIALSSLVISLCQNDKIEELRYKDKALEYRPELYSYECPIIDSIIFQSPQLIVVDQDSSNQNTLSLEVKLRLKGKISFVNIGNSKAIFYAKLIDDFCSRDLKLFYMLRDSANVNYQIIEDALPTSILQEDSITIEFNHILRHSQSDGFSLHILLIYMNEYENLFYTYYWAEYENITSKILSSHVKGDSVKYIVHIDSAVLKNKHCFSKNFNREDSQKIKMKHTKTLKQYLKTIKQND